MTLMRVQSFSPSLTEQRMPTKMCLFVLLYLDIRNG
jgi:hypothetical protein